MGRWGLEKGVGSSLRRVLGEVRPGQEGFEYSIDITLIDAMTRLNIDEIFMTESRVVRGKVSESGCGLLGERGTRWNESSRSGARFKLNLIADASREYMRRVVDVIPRHHYGKVFDERDHFSHSVIGNSICRPLGPPLGKTEGCLVEHVESTRRHANGLEEHGKDLGHPVVAIGL